MITKISPKKQSWQKQLADGISDPKALLQCLALDPQLAGLRAHEQFKTRVPHCFVARMQPGNINDPLLRQVLPVDKELDPMPGFSHDPLAEAQANPSPGLLHKYHGRVLLTLTSHCAINCRFCFRRHFPYAENHAQGKHWAAILSYIQKDSSIKEVIFSGGDPLLVSDQQLNKLCMQIAEISHIKTLRIHTRLPIVLPDRITPALIKLLAELPLRCVLVIHCNHSNEIDQHVIQAMRALQSAHITLLNQSVLLKGVNDNADALIHLSETLFDCGVLPYYLHLLDKVQGAAHFDIEEAQAKKLHQQMQAALPGYLVPKMVREAAQALSKLIVPS
ncbi:MAG: EF-P beta-lysylation protein EpmB [Gammaproteobacteria bacterium]